MWHAVPNEQYGSLGAERVFVPPALSSYHLESRGSTVLTQQRTESWCVCART